MIVQVVKLKAFTKNNQGGNAAGVVIDSDHLTEGEMQIIARKVGYSETAFIQHSTKADFRVRFFTPTNEVGLCGHATIAAYTALYKEGSVKPGEYTQELKNGILKVSVLLDGRVVMDQKPPAFLQELDGRELAEALGASPDSIAATGFPPQIVSTGLFDIIIPIDSRAHLFALSPNLKKIAEIEKKYKADSFHVFTTDSVELTSITNSRNFDPAHGIPEEAATGSAHGELACYLFHHGLVSKKQVINGLVFEQGYNSEMSSPSEIFAKLDIQGDKVERVRVGGYATLMTKTTIDSDS